VARLSESGLGGEEGPPSGEAPAREGRGGPIEAALNFWSFFFKRKGQKKEKQKEKVAEFGSFWYFCSEK